MTDPQWQRSTVLAGDVDDQVRELKSREGRDIVVSGGTTLVHELIALGLVDEYRLFVYPVVVGRGARLFDDATDVGRLRLLECRPFHSGVVLTRYTANE
jgi:dihydrofolate reductase